MQLVHITDLHYRLGDSFQIELISQLLNDFEREKGNPPPDFLVFSGDLVNNPDDKHIYSHFEKNFLIPVLTALRLPPSKVVLCPGNHDLSWNVQKKRTLVYDALQAKLGDQAYLDERVKNDDLQHYARDIAPGFFALAKKYGGAWKNPFFNVYNFGAERVSFVALNSAFGCSLRGSGADRGHLGISAALTLAAFQEVPAEHQIFSLVHHTFSDMNESTARLIVPIVERKSSLHFFGHVHQPKPSSVNSSTGSCFNVQGGALYEKSGYYNGYARIEFEPTHKHVSARYRSYYIDRSEFDVGTNVQSGGMFYNTPAAKDFFLSQVAPPSNDDVCLMMLLNSTSAFELLNETMTDLKLSETFVEPVISRPSQGEEKKQGDIEEYFPVEKILQVEDHIVIGADKEYGSTSLLRHITMRYYEDCERLPRAKVPVLLDARKLKSYEAQLTSQIKAGLPEGDSKSLRLDSLHNDKRLVLLIDEFNPGEALHLSAINALRNHFPRARLIVAAKIPLLITDHVVPVTGIDAFNFLQLRTLNRGRVRKLVTKLYKPASLSIDQIVEEIFSRFNALGIPLTASYVVIYLSILNSDRSFSPINSSNVVQNFVESVLQKYKPDYTFRSSFDYQNQIDYLAHIAEKMCRSNAFLVEYAQIYDWTKQYFDDIGIEQDFEGLIAYFYANKVYDRDSNKVFFRHNIFLSFFIAHQMRQSASFKDWILSEKTYMSYVNEIDIYCGLNRNDSTSLEFLAKEYNKYAKQLEEILEPLAWSDRLENLRLPVASDRQDFAEVIAKQLTQPNLSEDKRDALLDQQDETKATRPEIKRPEVQGILENWLMALRAYSVALKNLEGINKDIKEEHLLAILSGWATLLRYACLLFDTLIKDRELKVGPLAFRLSMPDNFKNSILRLVFLNMPLMISHLLRKDLGSPKLAVQLRNGELTDNMTVAFLQTGLYADLKLNNYLAELDTLYSRVKTSPFFVEAMLVKLRDIYIRFSMSDGEHNALKKLVVEMSADMKGFKGQARTDHISKLTEDLGRKELVARLRDASIK